MGIPGRKHFNQDNKQEIHLKKKQIKRGGEAGTLLLIFIMAARAATVKRSVLTF